MLLNTVEMGFGDFGTGEFPGGDLPADFGGRQSGYQSG
jgi:hypothetical protein